MALTAELRHAEGVEKESPGVREERALPWVWDRVETALKGRQQLDAIWGSRRHHRMTGAVASAPSGRFSPGIEPGAASAPRLRV